MGPPSSRLPVAVAEDAPVAPAQEEVSQPLAVVTEEGAEVSGGAEVSQGVPDAPTDVAVPVEGRKDEAVGEAGEAAVITDVSTPVEPAPEEEAGKPAAVVTEEGAEVSGGAEMGTVTAEGEAPAADGEVLPVEGQERRAATEDAGALLLTLQN